MQLKYSSRRVSFFPHLASFYATQHIYHIHVSCHCKCTHSEWLIYKSKWNFLFFFSLPFFVLLTPWSSIFIWTCILSQPVDLNIKSQWVFFPNTPSRENIFFLLSTVLSFFFFILCVSTVCSIQDEKYERVERFDRETLLQKEIFCYCWHWILIYQH